VKDKGTLFKKVVILPKGSKAEQHPLLDGVDHVLEDSHGNAYEGYNIYNKAITSTTKL